MAIVKRGASLYVAGPMTGIPQFNFPAFDAMTERLRALGYTVHSPAEMDDPDTRAAAMASEDGAPGSGSANGETWGDFLARDVKLLADNGIEGVVCLPGWEHSRGARLETFVAYLVGLPIMRLDETDTGGRGRSIGVGLIEIKGADLAEAWMTPMAWSEIIDELDEWTE